MTTWVILVTVAAAVAAAISAKTGSPRARMVTVVLTVGALLSVGAHLLLHDEQAAFRQRMMKRELAYTQISTRVLGEHLAQRYPGTKALVIYPFRYVRDNDRFNALLQGLEEGLGDAVETVHHDPWVPEVYRVDDPARQKEAYENLPVHTWYTADYFDKIIEQHGQGCRIVISLTGLPEDQQRMRLWQRPDRPAMVLGWFSVPNLREMVDEGRIDAAVTVRTKPAHQTQQDMPPDDLQTAFDQRYELLSAKPGNPG